ATSPGRCVAGDKTGDLYKPFTIQPLEPVEITFNEPVRKSSITLATQCSQTTGRSVRIEETDASGATCLNIVAGTLIVRERSLAFIPDAPWAAGKHYMAVFVSGG